LIVARVCSAQEVKRQFLAMVFKKSWATRANRGSDGNCQLHSKSRPNSRAKIWEKRILLAERLANFPERQSHSKFRIDPNIREIVSLGSYRFPNRLCYRIEVQPPLRRYYSLCTRAQRVEIWSCSRVHGSFSAFIVSPLKSFSSLSECTSTVTRSFPPSRALHR